ncbi:hypothetical protein [Modestobacter sp. L9-4]|nr:hypothetical protein [Modestobacter sp. L9-4]
MSVLALVAAPFPAGSGGGNAPIWLVAPFMAVIVGVLFVRVIRRH